MPENVIASGVRSFVRYCLSEKSRPRFDLPLTDAGQNATLLYAEFIMPMRSKPGDDLMIAASRAWLRICEPLDGSSA